MPKSRVDDLYDPQIGDLIECWFAKQFRGRITYIQEKDGHIPTLYYVKFKEPLPKNKYGSGMLGIILLPWQIKLIRRKNAYTSKSL